MIGLDTNVLVRYFAKDDEAQFDRACSLMNSLSREKPGFIPLVTLAELIWVLRSRYATTKFALVQIIGMLLQTQSFVLENAETVGETLRHFALSGGDFSNLLIAGSAAKAGCVYTVTFDEKAAQTAGMRLVP